MRDGTNHRSQHRSTAVLGVLLVVAGIVFLAQRYLPLNIAEHDWPLFVVLGGLVLLIAGLAIRSVSGLIVIGSITIVVGLILGVQNTFGLWTSWSYAWALVAPGSIGLGIAIRGLADRNPRDVERGGWMTAAGLALFAVFGLFFEGGLRVIGIDLGNAGNVVLPLVLIGIGLAFLVRTFARSGRGPGRHTQ